MNSVHIRYNLTRLLHPGQLEVARNPARFKVLSCGRRWGKTRLGVALCTTYALEGKRAWWVAPSYPIAGIGWDEVKGLARQIPGVEIREGDRIIRYPGGGSVQVRSADNPDSLRGIGLDFVVLDEAAFMKEEAWIEAIRPALSDRGGHALIISTPNGRNWFYRLFMRGADPLETEWASWQQPTTANQTIKDVEKEVEAARGQLPQQTFAQEYLAEFVEDGGLVFRNIGACTYFDAPHTDGDYVMGVDWAQAHDFTVLVVIDTTTKRVVEIDRFNQLGWDIQRGRLKTLARKWSVRSILAEQNSIGGPNIEALQLDGLPIEGFLTTVDTKAELIRALVLAFEQGAIGILPDDVLIGELESFAAQRLPSGKWRYAAPDNMHDDTVIALALAYWQSLNSYADAGVYIGSDDYHFSGSAY